MRGLRAGLISGLMALLLLTGLGAATARGAMAADGDLCAVKPPATVVMAEDGLPLFDGDGVPVTVADMASCLECLTISSGLPDPAPAPSSAMILAGGIDPLAPSMGAARAPFCWIQARAPPATA